MYMDDKTRIRHMIDAAYEAMQIFAITIIQEGT